MSTAKTLFSLKTRHSDRAILSLQELPAMQSIRWVWRRKVELVVAVRGGLISFEEARQHFSLSTDEFQAWESDLDRYGSSGLRVSRRRNERNMDSSSKHGP